MTKQELLKRLADCDMIEPESGHEKADNLLLDYINDSDITRAFKDLCRWYA